MPLPIKYSNKYVYDVTGIYTFGVVSHDAYDKHTFKLTRAHASKQKVTFAYARGACCSKYKRGKR